MKKVLLIISTILLLLLTTACTKEVQIPLSVVYTRQTGECIITNNTNKQYENVKIHFEGYDEKGYKKELVKEVEKLDKGETLTFNLSELTEIPEEIAQLKLVDFEYLVIPTLLAFILLLSVSVVLFAIVICIIISH